MISYLQTQKVIRLMTDQSITLEAMEGMTVDQLIKVANMDPRHIRYGERTDEDGALTGYDQLDSIGFGSFGPM
jgi:hypothetical protein